MGDRSDGVRRRRRIDAVSIDRVAAVTGGGTGLGRSYAVGLAERGWKVLVSSVTLDAAGHSSAADVVEEIHSRGGEAETYVGDLSRWDVAGAFIDRAVQRFGRLDALVNNAGVLRDRMLANMTEEEWDTVVNVHLKAQAATLHWAASYWRASSKDGRAHSGGGGEHDRGGWSVWKRRAGQLRGRQSRSDRVDACRRPGTRPLRGAGKRRSPPWQRTRQTESLPGIGDAPPPPGSGTFDRWSPKNVATVVCWLVEADCPFTGQVFNVQGGDVVLYDGWTIGRRIRREGPWNVEDLRAESADWPHGPPPFAPPAL